jgi:putative intracellular protease/amidase
MAQRYYRPLLRGLTYALAIVLVPLLAGVTGVAIRIGRGQAVNQNPPAFSGALPTLPPHDPNKPTAVVIAANSGTEGSDFLAPYAVLGTSRAFNLYAVAPEQQITHLFPGRQALRGVDVVPHYSFDGYDAAIGGAPDLIVIPFLPNDQAPEYQEILQWVRAHAGPDTILLSICAGAMTLAETGLLDGRTATTHHLTFEPLAQKHPSVKLVRGVRYVEDGNVVTSAGITAGVDASLFVLKRLLGRDAALGVAQELGYPHTQFLDDPAYDLPVAGTPSALLSGYQLGDTQLGVGLYPGISEIALASVVDTYPHQGTVTVQTVAPERTVVLSRHGLALVPRWGFADAPELDRLILPGTPTDIDAAQFEGWAAERDGMDAEQVHQAGGYPYDVTLQDMARRAGSDIADETVYLLEYPIGQVPGEAPRYVLSQLLPILGLALLGLGLASLIDRRRTTRKREAPASVGQPAPRGGI